MIKDIKLGIAMMRNGLNYAGALGAILLIVVASLLYLIFVPVPMMSGVFIAAGVLGIVQQVYTATISTMVQSSPYKKKLRTIIPAYIAGIAMLIGNTMSLVIHWITYLRVKDNLSFIYTYLYGYDSREYANSLIICALFMILFLLYMTASNVFFWQGILFGAGAWILIRFLNGKINLAFWELSIREGIILSYIIVLLGAGCLYVLNCLIYKLEYSEVNFRGLMKRASK